MENTERDFCPSHKCNYMKLLPFFLDLPIEQTDVIVPPSKLLEELQLPLYDRLDQLCKPTRKRRVRTEVNTFSRTPDIVVYQNFEKFKSYRATLSFLNIKSTSRNLKIKDIGSPYFDIQRPGVECDCIKVAPGVTYVLTIIFKPTEIRDYNFEIVCISNEETFVVPIYAIGHRPLLHISDEIEINPTGVRVTAEKSCLVHNYSKVNAYYVNSIEEPFSIYPMKGCLEPSKVVEIKLSCTPTSFAAINSELTVLCSDLILKIPISCRVEEADILFDRRSIEFSEVFVGLQNYKKIVLSNKSPYTLNFMWKQHETAEQEEEQKYLVINSMHSLNELEKNKFAKLEYMEVINKRGHEQICDKHFRDKLEELETEMKFLYKNSCFNIIPIEGRVHANQALDFTVIFSPNKNEVFLSTAYLDITGKIERLAFNLSGMGRGPSVIFNISKLDIGSIFLEVVHEYQVVVKNEGCIPATVVFTPKKTEFGGKIDCNPYSHHLKRTDTCKTFVISFSSQIQGQFVERVEFVIRESSEVMHFLLVGNVVCPILKPNVENIPFGEISFGEVLTKEIIFSNDSQVPIDFCIDITNRTCSLVDSTCDFYVEPQSGVVDPFSCKKVTITLKANVLHEVSENMIIMMYGSALYTLEIPIEYSCLVPELISDPKEVYINFCFLNYEYVRSIKLINVTKLSGALEYTPEEEPKDMKVLVHPKSFVICSEAVVEVNLTISTDVPGLHEYPLIFTLLGEEKGQELCKISCNGQGPVVSYFPDELHFGNVTLLCPKSKKLTLTNDSPIPAQIKITTEFPGTIKVSSDSFHIPPEAEKVIDVEVFLKDNGKLRNQLYIDIENGDKLVIQAYGEGVGYSILCEPQLQPEYNFGSQLTHRISRVLVNFTNLGKKTFKLYWTQKPLLKNFKDLENAEKLVDKKAIFVFNPHHIELMYNQSKFIEISCSSKKPNVLKEYFYCYAQIDKSAKVHTVFTVLLKVTFLEAKILFSSPSMDFVEMHAPLIREESLCCLAYNEDDGMKFENINHENESVMSGEITITNKTEIPLNLRIHTSSDFFILDEDEPMRRIEHTLDADENFNTLISFRPNTDDRRYKKQSGKLMVDILDYPKSESITLTGEICFPSLKFIPDVMNFGCIPLGSCACRSIALQNVTFLPVDYTWELDLDSLIVEKLPLSPLPDLEEIMFVKRLNSNMDSSLNAIAQKSKDSLVQVVISLILRILNDPEKSHMSVENEKISESSLSQQESFVSQEMSLPQMSDASDNKIYEKVKEILGDFVFGNDDTKIIDHWYVRSKERLGNDNNRIRLNDIITIEPWKGCLKPFEYGLLSIFISPPPNIYFSCTALCTIEGGEQERIEISGMSSNLMYEFNKPHINVGNKLFCEIFETSLILTNTGFYDFNFQVNSDSGDIFQLKRLKSRWLNVDPEKCFLEAGKSVNLKIRYFPGITGIINENVIIEMDYLDPVKIPMHGTSVFSQVALSLRRPEMNKFCKILNYIGISSITENFLQGLQYRKRKSLLTYVPGDMDNDNFTWLDEQGWDITFVEEFTPTVTEIDLAIERIILNEHLKSNYDLLRLHSVQKKNKLIPEFKVPQYRLDFGNVIVERPVCFTVLIVNYGPDATLVRKMRTNLASLAKNEISIEYKKKLIGVGEIAELHVIFKPRRKCKDFRDMCIKDFLFLGVNHGAIIPIVITATVALPRFRFFYKCLDFGVVKVGNAYRKSIIIENDGCVTTDWTTSVISLNNLKNAYYIIPNHGELTTMDRKLMHIYFIPQKHGNYNSRITVNVEGNPTPFFLELCGHGIIPKLVFKEEIVRFESNVPYTTENVQTVLLQNVSTFPIEFCFSDFDDVYDEEKMLMGLFMEYHNLKILLIPERRAGMPILNVFKTTYSSLVTELKKVILTSEDYDIDVVEKLSKDEIVALIKEHVKPLNVIIEDNTTDIRAIENEDLEGLGIVTSVTNTIPETRHGVILIFHGSPVAEYYKAANAASKKLGLYEVMSIDRLICQELVNNKSEYSSQINKKIEEALLQLKYPINDPQDDDYDMLLKKIDTILYGKKEKGAKGNKKSPGPDSKKVAKTTFLDLSPQLFANLLKPTFDNLRKALIIESLNSVFLPNPIIALEVLLHGIGNVKSIMLVILSVSLSNYINNEVEVRYKKYLIEEEIKKKIREEKEKKKSFERHFREKQRIVPINMGENLAPQPNVTKSKSDEKITQPKKKPKKAKSEDGELSNKTKKSKDGNDSKKSKKSKKDNEKSAKDAGLVAISKQVTKEIPKSLENQFNAFDHFLSDVIELSEEWDRRQLVLIKPPPIAVKPDKKHKPKSKKTSLSLSFTPIVVSADDNNKGIPIVVVNNAAPSEFEGDVSNAIGTLLQLNCELQKSMKGLKGTSNVVIKESSCMYSVLKNIKRYQKAHSDVFKIEAMDISLNSPQFYVEDMPSEIMTQASTSTSITPQSVKSKQRRRKGSTAKEEPESFYVMRDDTPTTPFSLRVIGPGEIWKYKITFLPQDFGQFCHNYRIEMVGYRLPVFIKCEAACELPRLNFTPELMFPYCLITLKDKAATDNFVYGLEEEVFDFGPIIVATSKTPAYETEMFLKNPSQMMCDINLEVDENSPFQVKDKIVTIQPEDESPVILTCRGTKKGNVTTTVYMTISKNPVVYALPLQARVCPLEFTITPKFLTFEKVPLLYSVSKVIKLINSTPRNLTWNLDLNAAALKTYKFSQTNGTINFCLTNKIDVEYSPTIEETNPKIAVNLEVFDPNCSNTIPFLREVISLQSDSVEYVLDYKDHIDLGEIKGKIQYNVPFELTNGSKTFVNIEMEQICHSSAKNWDKVSSFFQVTPQTEVLQPQKSSAIVFIFNPVEELSFKQIPIFLCKFLDVNKPNAVVKSFEIKFSAEVYLSRFALVPATDVYFGAIDLAQDRTQILLLKNTGKCPFNYIITEKNKEKKGKKDRESDADLSRSSKSSKSTKKSDKSEKSKGSKPSKGSAKTNESKNTKDTKKTKDSKKSKDPKKEAKIKETTLKLKEFSITSSTGEVLPGQTAQVRITAKPTNLTSFKDAIKVKVTEPLKGYHKGRILTLHAEGAEPKLVFDDYQRMYKEHFVVENEEDFHRAEGIGNISYFVISKDSLFLENICVNTTYTAQIYLQNVGQVPAETTLKILDSKNFLVNPPFIRIEPYSTSSFSILFKPDSIGSVEGKLDIRYNALNNNLYTLNLIGNSCVPQIQLTNINSEDDSIYKIYFTPTYTEEVQINSIDIKNVGIIPCQIIVSFTESCNSVFYLTDTNEPDSNNFDIEHIQENSSMKIRLVSLETKSLYVIFKPSKKMMAVGELKLLIVNNPYETKRIQLFGQCYGGDIVISGIPARNPNEWDPNQNEVSYILDFGYAPLKLTKKQYFSIRNNSPELSYKFEFKSHIDFLHILPSVGHLKPFSKKEIFVEISSKMPMTIVEELVELSYVPIKILESDFDGLSWDDRHQLLSSIKNESINKIFYESGDSTVGHFRQCIDTAIEQFTKQNPAEGDIRKHVEMSIDKREPKILIESEEWFTLNFVTSFTSDFASYSCQTTELVFPETYVRNKNELSFEIENTGIVPLNIEWKLICVDIIKNNSLNDNIKQPPDTLTNKQSIVRSKSCSLSHDLPFEIIPKKITIPPGRITEHKVIFTPVMESKFYIKLKSKINSLRSDLTNLEIAVTAQSLVPDYYFELDESDYVKRRNVVKCGRVEDANLKVIEINAIGIGVTVTKSFSLVNSSPCGINFKMEPIIEENRLTYFHCPTPFGTLEAGKKYELKFCFTPQEIGTFEAEYLFTIKEKRSETRFLIAGFCHNPKVYFKTAHIHLKPTLVSLPCQEKVVLRNDENEEIWFKISKLSLLSQDSLQKLKIMPISATLLPQSETELLIVYNAELVGEATFFVQCSVNKMTSPLMLNITAKCIQIECRVQYTNMEGAEVTLDPKNETIIDMGKIGIKTKHLLIFTLTNLGVTGFFYNWVMSKSTVQQLIHVAPKKTKEFIKAGTTVKREIFIETFRKYALNNYQFKLVIPYGPTYLIKLNVTAEFSVCELSFTNYNFGNCVVQPGMRKYYFVNLEAKNREPQPVKLENHFLDNENLTVDFKNVKIASNCKKRLPIYFHPIKEGPYEFNIPLVLKCVKRFVKITGNGVKINVQLFNPHDVFIDMGQAKLGETKTYNLLVINRSATQFLASLILSDEDLPPITAIPEEPMKPEICVPNLSANDNKKKETKSKGEDTPKKKGKKDKDQKSNKSSKGEKKKAGKDENKSSKKSSKKNEKSEKETKSKEKKDGSVAFAEEFQPKKLGHFRLYPSHPVLMEPNKKYEFILEFTPHERQDKYTNKVYYKIFDYVGLLSSIKGNCLIPEYSLDQDLLTFCNVLVGTERVNNVLLKNTGDIGIKFKWITECLAVFKLTPVEGYLPPKSDIIIVFTFKCDVVEGQIFKKCKCLIDNKHPLEISLVANTIEKPEPEATIRLACPVRESCVENIILTNPYKVFWKIHPTVSNNNFSVPKEILLEPLSTILIPVEYHPTRMTSFFLNETATLIIPLDDKKIHYELIGTAEAPLSEKRMAFEIRAKQNHCQIFKIRNWSNVQLCCQVQTILKSAPTPKTLYKTFGLESVELQVNEVKNYKWNIYVINEETLQFNVIFKDIVTNEYIYYDVTIKVLPPLQKPTIELVTCVRQLIKTKIKLENPINIPVTYTLNGGTPELQHEKITNMQPYTKNEVEITYSPLKIGEVMTVIEARSNELGTISYPFRLVANSPPKEQEIKFVAELGFKAYENVVIKNTFASSMDISAKFEDPQFSLEKSSSILPGETSYIPIKFEPSDLGVIESEVTLSSATSGGYTYPLYGECILPTPKGPYFIKPGGITSIIFFNPFQETFVFFYNTDTDVFETKVTSEEIKGRKTTKIIVSCPYQRSNVDSNYPRTGKLIVSCGEKNEIKWSFYLQTEK